MLCVNWRNAAAFAVWSGMRLPTEAQREKAARGGLEGADYPWADDHPHKDEHARDLLNWRGARQKPGLVLWDGKSWRVPHGHAAGDALEMLDLLLLTRAMLQATCRSRGDLVLENLLLRHQLIVLTRPTRRRRVRFRSLDQLLWVLLRRLRRDWRRHLVGGTPDTVVRWHRAGWRLYWRWRSRSTGGRPRLSPEVQEVIARMSKENPLWGSARIRGELLTLGITVSKRSIRRYRGRSPRRPLSQTWRTLLANHAHAIWAADLFVVQTLTFKTLYVLVFISHGRRELVHLGVTAHPMAAWVWRQVVEATPWGTRPTHLIPIDKRHLSSILAEFADSYNKERPQRTLQLDTPPPPQPQERSRAGPLRLVRTRPVLGGLHHVYEPAAA